MDDNIHAPTVPSGPTTGRSATRDLSKLSLTGLREEKERIEAELSALSSVLSSVRSLAFCLNSVFVGKSTFTDRFQHGVDMNTPLTTFDGFPRDDIDVAQSTYAPKFQSIDGRLLTQSLTSTDHSGTNNSPSK